TVGSNNTKARYNNEVDARARHTQRDYTAGFTVKLFTRTSAGLTLKESTLDFEDGTTFRGESLPRAFDGRTRGYDASVGVSLTPFPSFSVVYTDELNRFDQAPERNADSWKIMPTISFSPQGLINGTASFGYRKFNALQPGVPDFTGFITHVSVTMTIA